MYQLHEYESRMDNNGHIQIFINIFAGLILISEISTRFSHFPVYFRVLEEERRKRRNFEAEAEHDVTVGRRQ